MKIHRAAVVGCGALAQSVHLPNVMNNPRIELVSVCDLDEKVAKECSVKFNSHRYETNWEDVVAAKDIDFIILATHTNLRGKLIVPALNNGKPVYTEKPLSNSTDEMLRIVRASRQTGIPVCVGHNRRSSPAILEFNRLLDIAKSCPHVPIPSIDRAEERELIPEEKQMQILMRINDDSRSWKQWVFWDTEGIMFAEMVHFIDLALLFNSSYPVRAFAEGSPRGNFTLILTFADGSITTLQHSMVGNFDYPKELIEGTLNYITIAMDQHVEVRQMGIMDEPNIIKFPYSNDYGWTTGDGISGLVESASNELRLSVEEKRNPRFIIVNKGHYKHLDRFLDHMEGKSENPCDVECAVNVTRVTAKLLESARMGMPVAIRPEDWSLPSV